MTETTTNTATEPLLAIRDLEVSFTAAGGVVQAVRGADLTIYPGQTVAIVGESGSGKSTLAHAIISLLPGTGRVTGGSILIRQRGQRFRPGLNVGRGKDDTLFAKITGHVKFSDHGGNGRRISVIPVAEKAQS